MWVLRAGLAFILRQPGPFVKQGLVFAGGAPGSTEGVRNPDFGMFRMIFVDRPSLYIGASEVTLETMESPFLNQNQRIDKAQVPAGTIFTVQGKQLAALIILHSGMAEIVEYPGDPTEIPAEAMVLKSFRVGLIKGESICGIPGLAGGETETWSIRAVSDCVVSLMPMSALDAQKALQKNLALNFQVLRALQQRIESALFLFSNFKSLWRKLASISDSIALASEWGGGGDGLGGFFGPDRYNDTLPAYSQNLRTAAKEKSILPSEDWDPNLFLDTVQTQLQRYEEFEPLSPESIFDLAQYVYLKRLVRKPDQVLAALFGKDEPLNAYTVQFFSNSLAKLLAKNCEIAQAIRNISDGLFGSDGWVSKLLNHPDVKNNYRLRVFIHYLWKFSLRCHTDSKKLLEFGFDKNYPVFTNLAAYREMEAPPAETASAGTGADGGSGESEAQAVDPAVVEKYKGLATKILTYAEVGQDFMDEFLGNLVSFKSMTDKLATDKPAVQLRNRLAEMYWELYEICMLKALEDGLSNWLPGIMLHFGLIDEGLVTPAELTKIDSFYNDRTLVEEPIAVMTLPHFLRKIHFGEVNPSMSEMGESFAELLRRQAKMSPKELAATVTYEDSPMSKLRYEIRVIAKELSRLLGGARNRSVPFLCSENLPGNLNFLYQKPEKLSGLVDEFRQRDFTIFYREVVLKHGLGTDLVQKEVLPNFVLYPVGGSRSMMWQEIDGTRKDSAARFFLPLFYSEKIEEAITSLLASFRWELARTVAGHNWMDPVEGGLCGAYYDYITFYKKNPNLSPTYKDQLREFIARTRSDKERFTEDYVQWVLYEYDNKIRLNPVARGIFYRYCPFQKEVRAEMAKKPLYADLEMKLANRNHRESLRLESRMKKFEKSNVEVPFEMRKYMDMLAN